MLWEASWTFLPHRHQSSRLPIMVVLFSIQSSHSLLEQSLEAAWAKIRQTLVVALSLSLGSFLLLSRWTLLPRSSSNIRVSTSQTNVSTHSYGRGTIDPSTLQYLIRLVEILPDPGDGRIRVLPTHRNLEEVAESYNADANLIKFYDEYRRERRDCGNPLTVSWRTIGAHPPQVEDVGTLQEEVAG